MPVSATGSYSCTNSDSSIHADSTRSAAARIIPTADNQPAVSSRSTSGNKKRSKKRKKEAKLELDSQVQVPSSSPTSKRPSPPVASVSTDGVLWQSSSITDQVQVEKQTESITNSCDNAATRTPVIADNRKTKL